MFSTNVRLTMKIMFTPSIKFIWTVVFRNVYKKRNFEKILFKKNMNFRLLLFVCHVWGIWQWYVFFQLIVFFFLSFCLLIADVYKHLTDVCFINILIYLPVSILTQINAIVLFKKPKLMWFLVKYENSLVILIKNHHKCWLLLRIQRQQMSMA